MSSWAEPVLELWKCALLKGTPRTNSGRLRPVSNRGPLDMRSDALPTELSTHWTYMFSNSISTKRKQVWSTAFNFAFVCPPICRTGIWCHARIHYSVAFYSLHRNDWNTQFKSVELFSGLYSTYHANGKGAIYSWKVHFECKWKRMAFYSCIHTRRCGDLKRYRLRLHSKYL